jgi:hypothetical protein
VKAGFSDPIIIRIVAVISNISPMLRKTNTRDDSLWRLCSVITAMEYEIRARFTMLVPRIRMVFMVQVEE